MKCETKIPYKVHDKQETTSHYLCDRTVKHIVQWTDIYGNTVVTPVCAIHLKVLEKEVKRLKEQGIDMQLIVTDAK